MIRTILADADIFAFKASSATEKTYLWDGPEGELSVAEHLEEALELAQSSP